MHYSVTKVKPLENYHLKLTFKDGSVKVFDFNPYLNEGVFRELQDVKKFNSVYLNFNSIEWENEIDFAPETLYNLGKSVN